MRSTNYILFFAMALLCLNVQAQFRSNQFELLPDSIESTTVRSDKKAARRMLVFEAIAQNLPWSSKSLKQAATIFQHTNTESEPDDGEEYRSQEMHLFAFFLYKEMNRIDGGELPTSFLGPYRYTVTMGLPNELATTYLENSNTKKWEVAPNMVNDRERLRRGFPFALFASLQTVNPNPLSNALRSTPRDDEISQLYFSDQQTRSLFKKDEMIFNRYIERISDAQRRARLYEMMALDVMWDRKTLFEAAKILHDTRSTLREGRKIRFQLQENHLFAFFLAYQAYLKGEKAAGPLVVTSLNTYLKVSKMPDAFGLQLSSSNSCGISQRDLRISVEQWGKYEFPFHLGRLMKALCDVSP